MAQQCSGIHSALSLLITTLPAANVLLRSAWKRTFLVLSVLPVAILKNAIRIVSIAWLGMNVDPAVFEGPLHRQGGLLFSLLALGMMAILVWLLRRRFSLPGRANPTPHSARIA